MSSMRSASSSTKYVDGVEADEPLPHQVEQAAGRGDDERPGRAQRVLLAVLARRPP